MPSARKMVDETYLWLLSGEYVWQGQFANRPYGIAQGSSIAKTV